MELIINYFNRLTLLFLQEIVQKRIERMQRKVEGMHNLSVMLEVLITILIIIILIMVEGMHNLSVMLDVLLHIKNLDKCSQVFYYCSKTTEQIIFCVFMSLELGLIFE